MDVFGALDAASTGVQLGRVWMDATANNVANVNTVRPAGQPPFRAQEVVASSLPGLAGVTVSGIVAEGGAPDVVYDPENPLADANGNVTRPKVDLTTEMTNMMLSTRLYQANLSVMKQAEESYRSALDIGKH